MSVFPTIDPVCSRSAAAQGITTVVDADRAISVASPSGACFPQRRAVMSGRSSSSIIWGRRFRSGTWSRCPAGGIVHSERTGPELRRTGSRTHGLQLWVGLPLARGDRARVHRHPAATLPSLEITGARIRVLAGSAFGEISPVKTFSPLFYADVVLPAGRELLLPNEREERATYVIDGTIACGSERAEHGRMMVFAPEAQVALHAITDARIALLGGAPLDGERHIWWKMVSTQRTGSSRPRRTGRKAASRRSRRQGRFIPLQSTPDR